MTKHVKTLLGPVMAGALGAALLCGTGVAKAQDYDNDYNYRPAQNESVIVRPSRHPLGVIQHDQMLGGGRTGSLYSERVSLSEPVSYSDLDLARVNDRRTLQSRVRSTALNICAKLIPEERGAFDQDNTRQCVTTAIRDAMDQVPQG